MNSLFSHRIEGNVISFKYASGSSERSGKEFHIYHELIFFLDGDAELISENLHTRIQPETLLIIPKETYHQVVIHGDPERYCRCVLQFDDTEEIAPMSAGNLRSVLMVEANQEIQYLFKKMIAVAKSASPHAEQIIKAALVLLLDILTLKIDTANEDQPQNETVRLAVAYINQNIGQPLSVQKIAQICNTSTSSLAHVFKKEMYCSIYKFIIKKRLICAHHRIIAGDAPSVVSVECGFPDYSGFYKQYKKAFGFPPSQR